MQGGFWNRSKTRKIKKLLKRYGLNKKFSASDFSSVEDFKRTLKRLKVEHERRKKERENKGDEEGERLNEEIMMLVQQFGLMSVAHPAVSEPFEPVEAAIVALENKKNYFNNTDESGLGATLEKLQPDIDQIKAMLQGLAGNKDQTRVLNHLKGLTALEKSLKANEIRYEEEMRSNRAELQRLMADWAVCPVRNNDADVQARYRELAATNILAFLKAGLDTLRSDVLNCATPEAQRTQLLQYLATTLVNLELPLECKDYENERYGYFGETIATEKNKLKKLQVAVRDGTVKTMQEVQPAVASATATREAIVKYCRDVQERGRIAILSNSLPSKYQAAVAGGLALAAFSAFNLGFIPTDMDALRAMGSTAYSGLASGADYANSALLKSAMLGNLYQQSKQWTGYGNPQGSYALPSVEFSRGHVQPQAGNPQGSYAVPSVAFSRGHVQPQAGT